MKQVTAEKHVTLTFDQVLKFTPYIKENIPVADQIIDL